MSAGGGSPAPPELDVNDAAIAAQEGSQRCERFLRAPLVAVCVGIVPRQRHWMSETNDDCDGFQCRCRGTKIDVIFFQGCSQKALAPLAIVLLPLSRHWAGSAGVGVSPAPDSQSSDFVEELLPEHFPGNRLAAGG